VGYRSKAARLTGWCEEQRFKPGGMWHEEEDHTSRQRKAKEGGGTKKGWEWWISIREWNVPKNWGREDDSVAAEGSTRTMAVRKHG